jgi:hypothetical protein
MRRLLALSLLVALSAAGCTQAEMERYAALGKESHVICYSGGEVIYDGWSTGRVISPQNSDGWQFEEKSSGNLVEVSGDCVLRVES